MGGVRFRLTAAALRPRAVANKHEVKPFAKDDEWWELLANHEEGVRSDVTIRITSTFASVLGRSLGCSWIVENELLIECKMRANVLQTRKTTREAIREPPSGMQGIRSSSEPSRPIRVRGTDILSIVDDSVLCVPSVANGL